MTISHSAQFIFIHVHRTGGTSLNTLFKNTLGRDVDIRSEHGNARRPDVPKFTEYPHYFKFGFTRNPWDRMLSWYTLIHQNDRLALAEERNRFETFLATDASADFNLKTFHYNSLDYFLDENGTLHTDAIFRYENFATEVQRLAQRLDIKVDDIPSVNGTHQKNYRDYYTEKSKQLIAEKCHKDIAFFNYLF